jgi:hypothetical protein
MNPPIPAPMPAKIGGMRGLHSYIDAHVPKPAPNPAAAPTPMPMRRPSIFESARSILRTFARGIAAAWPPVDSSTEGADRDTNLLCLVTGGSVALGSPLMGTIVRSPWAPVAEGGPGLAGAQLALSATSTDGQAPFARADSATLQKSPPTGA